MRKLLLFVLVLVALVAMAQPAAAMCSQADQYLCQIRCQAAVELGNAWWPDAHYVLMEAICQDYPGTGEHDNYDCSCSVRDGGGNYDQVFPEPIPVAGTAGPTHQIQIYYEYSTEAFTCWLNPQYAWCP